MNKDSRVKDKLTGEIIDKSLSLSVKPRGKSRFIYFKNKEACEKGHLEPIEKASTPRPRAKMEELSCKI